MGAPKVFRCGRTMTGKSSITQPATRHGTNKPTKYDLADLEWTKRIPECPTYYPSEHEFDHPLVFLQKIAPEASKYGICKIVSPIAASNPAAFVLMKEKKDFKFETNLQPLRLSKWNEKETITFSMSGRKYTYHEFEALANKTFFSRFHCSGGLSSSCVEKEFWHEMMHGEKGTVEYGVNVEGSAFSCDPDDKLGISKWNLKNFSRLLQSPLRLVDREIPGITDPMLYIGMLFSMFAWHVEDHYLYSINYHHSGASKTWYGVPGYAASHFEKTVLQHVYCNKILPKHGEDEAFRFLAQKTTMFPPNVMLQHDVDVYKAVQKPGEFIITFPRAYHAGFSHGFNCGEAVNFATDDWFPFGAAASRRYAVLRMMPLIPYEELLCKEAMLVYKSSSRVRSSKNKPEDTAPYKAIVQPFLHLMQFYMTSLLRLKSSRNLQSYSNTSGLLICRICHRDCYVAYLLCKYCFSHPICLFHEIAPHTCICGRFYSVYIRNDILELEEAAKSFQQKKVCCTETFSVSSLFSCNRNECIKHLEGNPWQQENSVRGTANSQGAASKPKTQVADCIKQCVENKTRMLHWRNNVLPSVKSTNRPEIIYNLRKRKSN
ncbi:lysine-specific demethylase JMJ706-like [Vigna radiata var. radiata]|uniref:Lysine-specific demethylase JMJ706-like n=1 Tax=Vigna radiata var. radiata TaxID=3916 RepID=A0A1S3TAV7_VIGRR|nr:lysine-specific demethylase JMJ706-like [Vigna radiata var. radiata]